MDRVLSALSAIVIIVAGTIYITHQLDAYAAKNAERNATVQQIIARATARKRLDDDYNAWWAATKANDARVHDEETKPCYVAVNKLRAINTATAAHVIPFYKDAPSDLRAQINACVKSGAYTSAQVADVMD
jgi:hypothetical protein